MAGAFGLSKTGKEAGGFAREAGATGRGQMYKQLERADEFGAQSEADRALTRDYYTKKQAGVGAPTVGDMTSIGEQIMPGVQPAIGTIAANRQKLADAQAGLTTAGTSAGAIRGERDQYGQLISRIGDTQGGMVNETYESMAARDRAISGAVAGGIAEDYGAIGEKLGGEYLGGREGLARGYGGIGEQIKGTYEDLGSGSGGSYSEAERLTELLRPGGEAMAAQTARSFAPQVAAANARLRRAGIDPNSPEGAAALQGIDTARSRAMDDTLASATEGYVDRKTQLTLQAEQDRAALAERGLTASTGFEERGLAAETDLRTRAAEAEAALGQEKSALGRGETLRTLSEQQTLEAQKTAAQLGISQDSFDRTKDWLEQGQNLELIQRGMEQEDYGTLQNLLQGMNDEQIQALDLLLKQYTTGQEQARYETFQKDVGTAGLKGLSTEELNAMFRASQDAGNWGDFASENYQDAYEREAANAGWATKLIANVGLKAATLIPGVGQYIGFLTGQGAAPSRGNKATGWNDPTFDFSKYGVVT